MTDFLLELRSEEIPARMQGKAKEDLARLFSETIAKAGLKAESVETFATPRRLALIANGLPLATEAVSEETKGPKVGAPPQALEGFLRKTGLTQDQLTDRDGVYFAVIEKPGRATSEVLAEAIPAIVRAFPWPKSMRWGAASASTESLRWVRPLQGIVAILGEDVVPLEVDGVRSGYQTLGHRFHHPGPITIGGAHDYVEKLRACHVIVHFSERCRIIREGAAKAAVDAGLVLVEDEGLVAENAGLTEWPVPMLGRFDPAFLDVPEEVIQLTARVNQKYFVCAPLPLAGGAGGGPEADTPTPNPSRKREGNSLAPAFVCTANIDATDGGAAIVAGNEKVLAARLSDARFFWEQDLKVPLSVQAEKLSQIVFHEKLGTVADKVARVAKLAEWLVKTEVVRGISPDLARASGELSKADLVTGMVGEFPELQGVVGAYYATAERLPPSVADAIRDHYRPLGPDDAVPDAPATVAVALADKIDTLVGFFAERMLPTGSRDPFALRRAALGTIRLIAENRLRMNLLTAFQFAADMYDDTLNRLWENWETADFWEVYAKDRNYRVEEEQGLAFLYYGDQKIGPLKDTFAERQRVMDEVSVALHDVGDPLLQFFADRLKVQQREAGVRHDLIDAVFALGGEDDLVRLLARVKALQGFVGTSDGADLLAAYKRAANFLKAAESENSSPTGWGGGSGEAADGGVSGADTDPSGPLRGRPPQRVGEELALHTALDTAEHAAQAAIEAEDFEGAMAALASLRAPIDAFFDGVMVNDEDPDKRAYRMGLLARFRDAVHRVADFSKIEG